MLNKVKKNILPMLDTLGDALTQYLAQASLRGELGPGIVQFIDAINMSVENESEQIVKLSQELKSALQNPQLAEVERLYNEYCTLIENLPVQYKAVFLPYYDNTWDSLASVYKSFAADSAFVTEIVIIPIRRNTPHGWKIVYEDYLTPAGIPNTPFDRYSFELDEPDFVFYNNPYDGVNIDKFMSHNIKPYAGCMIYIPYFLYRHVYVGDKNWLLYTMRNLSELPGHDSCDIFVVQGKSFLKNYQHRSRNGNKMIALGNPKTDNINQNIKEWRHYPEWEKAIEGKTVFFVNTHYTLVTLQTAFEYGYCWTKFLFQYAEEHSDIALIWRPHPQSFLMLSDSGASEEEILFRNLLDTANGCERIILDRTPSAVSAMMYSDAMFSTDSSIVAEYIFLGKPIFLTVSNPQELLPPDKRYEYTRPEYFKKLEKIREYNIKNLYLFDAVWYRGIDEPIPSVEDYEEHHTNKAVSRFIEDIKNGIDIKKELRGTYKEQLFVNRDGTVGEHILDYIKKNVLNLK